MKKITIVTTTRADYGLLSPIIKRLREINCLETEVVVTGSHLSSMFGKTVSEVESDGVSIAREIDILSPIDSPVGISTTMANALTKFSSYFEAMKPDALMVLGDRYETLAICLAALNSRIPIIHLHGGEITEGAIDNAIRHSITKLSSLHFASTDEHRKRIIQMGENPDTVFNVGAVGVENALNTIFYDKMVLEEELGIQLNKYALLTFHPVTLENNTAETQIRCLLDVVAKHNDICFVCTKANADLNGALINRVLEEYADKHSNIAVFDSLGAKKYLSLMRGACFVIGNSSSGIIEAPSFKIPTINIGDRQKGRTQAKSVINCEPNEDSIESSIELALSDAFRKEIMNVVNPYGNGKTSEKVAIITRDFLIGNKLSLQKRFYDLRSEIK